MPFGRCGGTREARNTVTESLVVLIGWVRTRFGQGGGQLDRRQARGGLKPWARESKARTGRFLWEKLMSEYVFFSSSYGGRQGAVNGQDSWGFFKDAQGFGRLDAGSRAGFTSSRLPLHHGPRCFNFPYFCTMCGLKKLGRVYQNWLERSLSVFLLRTLAVSRRQQSKSIEVALHGVRRFDEPF